MNRLRKGHPVKYFAGRSYADTAKKDGISFINVNYAGIQAILIEAFVSGDDERGLSVVALDNEKKCLFHEHPYNKTEENKITRKKVTKGYDDWMVFNCTSGFGRPTCPY